MKPPSFKLISKTIFFPREGILAIGDLHLGYDAMLKNQGINLSFDLLEETKKEIEIILKKIKALSTLKKIVLLGDIKHHFAFQKTEFFDLRNFLSFLEKFLPKENIILIKGNHDKFTLKNYELHDFYISDSGEIAFLHGHKPFLDIYSKDIKTIVMGHLHPAVIIKEKTGIKREKFKCFLIGKFMKKQLIIVPSFFPMVAGSEVDSIGKMNSIIKKSSLKSFETYVVGKNKVYDFGKFGEFKGDV